MNAGWLVPSRAAGARESAKDNIKININHAAFLALHFTLREREREERNASIHTHTEEVPIAAESAVAAAFFAIINATFAPLTNICALNAPLEHRESETSGVLFDRCSSDLLQEGSLPLIPLRCVCTVFYYYIP
jgi:hypothetical protein